MDLIPKDRWKIVWLIFLIQGIGTLLPWNMFITANDYYVNYKLKPVNESDSGNNYRNNFLAYVGVASKFPNLALQTSNFFYQSGSDAVPIRIIVSLIVQIAIFILTIVLAFVDTFSWITLFFVITIISLVLINMANGIYQSCLFALAANLPKIYTNSILIGMNISGILASIVLIVSLGLSPNPKISAIYYFTTAVIFLSICFISQLYLTRNKFYQHFQEVNINKEENKKLTEEERERNITILLRIMPKIYLPAMNNFMVMFVSLIVFPSIIANIVPKQNYIAKEYFNPVFCFLSFNVFSVIGNFMSNLFSIASSKSTKLRVIIWMRMLFIPFFLFCNFNPQHRHWPVLFDHDLYPIIGCILLAISSGYLSSIVQMNLPKCVELRDAPVAGMVACFSCLMGILAGVSSSPVFTYFI